MELARSVSVVVPAYNEAENLEAAVRDVLDAVRMFANYEIIVVNDGSQDETGAVADRLAAELECVRTVHHPANLGLAESYRTGLANARMAYFTFVPGDHEVTRDSLDRIFGAVGTSDLVVPYHGTPWNRTWHRRVLTFVCTTQINMLFGRRLNYYQGPTVYPTALARALPITTHGFFFCTGMLLNALAMGYSFVQVPLTHQERTYGRSKAVKLSNIIDAELTILKLWWNVHVRQGVAARPANLFEDTRPAFDY
jgi:glycosyltransferase involved in cell wall biosynthesis